MGDHRVTVKIEFDAHSKVYKTDMNINYFDNGDGIDQRIVDWFADCWRDALSRYESRVAEYYERYDAQAVEQMEREQLVKLKAKYDDAAP